MYVCFIFLLFYPFQIQTSVSDVHIWSFQCPQCLQVWTCHVLCLLALPHGARFSVQRVLFFIMSSYVPDLYLKEFSKAQAQVARLQRGFACPCQELRGTVPDSFSACCLQDFSKSVIQAQTHMRDSSVATNSQRRPFQSPPRSEAVCLRKVGFL